MKIIRLGNTFAAQAYDIDLRQPLAADEVDAIEQALAREGVLVFRNMLLNDDQQQAFIERFGPPSQVKLEELKTAKSAHPHFFDVSTVDDDGGKLDPNSARGMYLRANLLWHTDGSQAQPPIRLTALSAAACRRFRRTRTTPTCGHRSTPYDGYEARVLRRSGVLELAPV